MIQTYILNHLILKQFHHQNILNKIILRINQINFKTINTKTISPLKYIQNSFPLHFNQQ